MTTQTRAPRQRPKAALTFADLQAKIRRPRRIAEVVLDAEAAAQIDSLTEMLERAQARDEALGGEPVAPGIAKLLREAEERADASRAQIVFEAIPHTEYKLLITKHPALPEQAASAAAGEEQWPFDPDTFAPALVRAQMIDPVPGSDEEFEAFWDALSDGQLRHLWTTALGVQMQITTLAPRSEAAADLVRAIAAR
jgi:integrase